MKPRFRVVFDVNVIISAILFPDSVPGSLVFQSRLRVQPLVSVPLIAELHSVLLRPKLDRYVSRERRQILLAAYLSRADIVPITIAVDICRDPRDNHILELALSAPANMIITGDKDLLELHPFQGIDILNPSDASAHL